MLRHKKGGDNMNGAEIKKAVHAACYPAAAAWLKIPYSVHVPEYRPT